MPRPSERYPLARNTGVALTLSALIHALIVGLVLETPADGPHTTLQTQYELALLSNNHQQTGSPGDSAETQASNYLTANPEREPAAPKVIENKPSATKPSATEPPAKRPTPKPRRVAAKKPPPSANPKPSAADIIASGLALASSGLGQATGSGSRAPVASLNAQSGSPHYAAYLAAWTSKVERVGRLNYPNDAIPAGREMSLMLDVVVRADGSVAERQILRSSGSKTLDRAALNILKQASPFPPFPPDIAREHPKLRITRRWRFARQTLGLRP